MKKHQLKTVNPHFQDIWDKRKLFEVRKNDRNFQEGDKLMLREYDLETKEYSKRWITTIIGYILDDPVFCKEGFVIMQLSLSKFTKWGVL